jgi:transposase
MDTAAAQAHSLHKTAKVPGKAMYMAFDLGSAEWHVAFGDGSRQRLVTLAAGDLATLECEIKRAKRMFKLPASTPLRSCYEAGRDGFWLHRHLEETYGTDTNTVVDPASIEASRRKRRPKTDRIDARKLLRKEIQYDGGDNDVWAALHVPTRDQENERRLNRHREQLQKEISQHTNRIRSLAHLQKVAIPRLTKETIIEALAGETFGWQEQQEVLFAADRLLLARQQLSVLEADQKQRLDEARQQMQVAARAQRPACTHPNKVNTVTEAAQSAADYGQEVTRKVLTLTLLKSIGDTSAWKLATEFFWRKFNNRREVGAAAGLTPTPHNSGNGEREQGISKTGSSAVRDLMVELSWLWLRWQPQSALSVWFRERWGAQSKRSRKAGIVALARKLLIALWRFLEFGLVPDGAILKDEAA